MIKVRLQVTENNFKRTVHQTLPTDAPRSTANKAWRGVVWNSPFLRQGGTIVKNENDFRASAGRKPGYGWLALYQGLEPSLLGSAISWSGYFSSGS